MLIKHQGSRRPASWKDETGAEITKRTKEAAQQILLAHREDIMSSPNPAARFGELAAVHSDCSSARDKGSLGVFGPGQMQKVRARACPARGLRACLGPPLDTRTQKQLT